jgi:hypothetical protein
VRVFHQYGSKERLFEMVEKVSGVSLKEENLSNDKEDELLREFVKYAVKRLGLKNIPHISLINKPNSARDMDTFGEFDFNDGKIEVVKYSRNLADILRTLGHELVHHGQDLNNSLSAEDGETGSAEENEANEKAGILLREFGKLHPEIYE